MEEERVSPTAFMAEGNCRNYPTNVMYPENLAETNFAKKICAGCAVASVCLEYALDYREMHGVWGGESERARKNMLKRRRRLS